MDKKVTLTRAALVTLSLTATFFFLLGIGSGAGAVLFAIGGTVTQAAVLFFMPGLMVNAWDNEQLPIASAAAFALGLVILISVTGSVSILSGLAGEDAQEAREYARLSALAESKQASADKLIQKEYITKAQPLLNEVELLNTRIKALPTPSGFYIAAQRVAGANAETLITAVILALSVLLDVIALLLGIEIKPATKKEVITPRQPQPPEEVGKVLEALEDGTIERLSVRQVRGLLKCSQNKASQVANICKQLQLQLVN